jgi:hypothetical protein
MLHEYTAVGKRRKAVISAYLLLKDRIWVKGRKVKVARRHEDILRSGGIAPPFTTSALDGSSQFHAPASLPSEKRDLGTHWMGDLVGTRVCREWNSSCSAHSPLLYRLSKSGFQYLG